MDREMDRQTDKAKEIIYTNTHTFIHRYGPKFLLVTKRLF